MADAGGGDRLAGLPVPEALGGAGASWRELAAAAEEFGAAVAPMPFLGSAVVATAVLLSAARAAARDRGAAGGVGPSGTGARASGTATVSPAAGLLRQLAEGTNTAALAVSVGTGPGAPFPGDARVTGRAEGSPGGVRLRGTIRAVPDALLADVLLVPADGLPGALYLVEANAAGVHRTPLTSLDMTRQLCDITFDGALAAPVAVGAAAEAALSAGLAAGAVVLAAEQLGAWPSAAWT